MVTIQYSLRNLSQSEFIALLDLAIQNLDWEVLQLSNNSAVAQAPHNFKISVNIDKGKASFYSESTVEEGTIESQKEMIYLLLNQVEHLRAMHSPEWLSDRYATLQDKLTPEATVAQQHRPTNNKSKEFLQIFVPKQGYIITPIIIDLNVLIFILMILNGADFMSPSGEILLQWGANFRPYTLAGEGWRLLTACFLHIGVLHLFMNMYALLYIGILLEPFLGKARFITAYLMSGLTGSLLSLWWHDATISAGASGAIFGMEGLFLALLTTDLIDKNVRKDLLSSTISFVGFNLAFGLIGMIDNAGHIGGLLGGLAIGYAYVPSLKNPHNHVFKHVTIGIVVVAILTITVLVYRSIPNSTHIY